MFWGAGKIAGPSWSSNDNGSAQPDWSPILDIFFDATIDATLRPCPWREARLTDTGKGQHRKRESSERAGGPVRARGSLNADKRLVRLVGKRVGACLRHQRNKGLVRSEQGPRQHLVWGVTLC